MDGETAGVTAGMMAAGAAANGTAGTAAAGIATMIAGVGAATAMMTVAGGAETGTSRVAIAVEIVMNAPARVEVGIWMAVAYARTVARVEAASRHAG